MSQYPRSTLLIDVRFTWMDNSQSAKVPTIPRVGEFVQILPYDRVEFGDTGTEIPAGKYTVVSVTHPLTRGEVLPTIIELVTRESSQ